MARLRILGAGEAFDATNGNTSCLLHGRKLPVILFDCGYQIPERLWRDEQVYPDLEAVYFTHLHADHCFGIVPLLTRFWEEGRTRPLVLIGPPGTQALVQRLLDLGYPGIRKRLPFHLEFVEVRAGQTLQFNSLTLRFARTPHSVLNLAVRVELPGVGHNRAARSFSISGDGSLSPASARLFEGTDLLLQETYWNKPVAPVHGNLDSLIAYAAEAKLGRIGLTHLSRHGRAQIEKRVERIRKKDPRWFIVQPGMELELA